MANAVVARLLAARKEAVAAGDKALGRELYHQVVALGVSPEDIDSGVAEERANTPDVADPVPAPEVAVVEAPVEQAVPAKPKRTTRKK